MNGLGSQLLQAFLLSVESSSLSSLKLIVVTEFIYVILVYLKVMEAKKLVRSSSARLIRPHYTI